MILARNFKVAAYAGRRVILVAPSCASLARGCQYKRPTVFYLKIKKNGDKNYAEFIQNKCSFFINYFNVLK